MRTIKLTLQYDGTDFYGWQIQPDQRSVQAELQKTASLLFHEDIRIHGSGRTDRGVHAFAQTAHFQAETPMTCETMIRAFNANLPPDVSVLNAEDVPSDFHARFSVKSKTYRYTILNRPARAAIDRQYCFHCVYPLDSGRMAQELKAVEGTHDFAAFQGSHPYLKELEESPSTVRTILRTSVQTQNDLIWIDLEGDGFLYKMVRNIVGVVIRVGSGLLEPGTLKKILESQNKTLVKYTARAEGLALLKVDY